MKKPAGYSGTPLARKLGLKAGHRYLLRNAPDHYPDLFTDWPADTEAAPEATPGSLDFVHLFATTAADLQGQLAELRPLLKKDGLLWVSWPKGTSAIPTEINREDVRAHGLAAGLVDVKVCAVDADWSGLKFVYRRRDR